MSQTPWARPYSVEPLPARATREALLGLDDFRFARLIRDNLLVRQPEQRAAWDRLWTTLAADDDLADRTSDVLAELLGTTEAALGDGTLSGPHAKRAERFAGFCRDAQRRIDRPLAWAGPAARRFNTAAQQVIETLVFAIDAHRDRTGGDAASAADRELWHTLRLIGLDPAAPAPPPQRSS